MHGARCEPSAPAGPSATATCSRGFSSARDAAAGKRRVVSTWSTTLTSFVGPIAPSPRRIAWVCVPKPPTSVQLVWGRTAASISATFGHGRPQPPGASARWVVGRFVTESLQRDRQTVQPGTALADVERLGQVEGCQHGAGVSELPHGADRERRGVQGRPARLIGREREVGDEAREVVGADVAVEAVRPGETQHGGGMARVDDLRSQSCDGCRAPGVPHHVGADACAADELLGGGGAELRPQPGPLRLTQPRRRHPRQDGDRTPRGWL